MYHCSLSSASLADGASLDMIIVTPASDYPHMKIEAACGGDAELLLYEGVVYSGGNLEAVPNHKRYSDNVWAGTVLSGATVSDPGTQLSVQFMPGGRGGQASGAGADFDNEWVLKNGTAYLVRLTNRAGQAKRASLGCSHYSAPQMADG